MTDIYMPRLSDTMEEGVISSWVKQVGDKVEPGDVLLEIETDKAVMEHEAYEEGYLVKQSVSQGDTVAIGAVIGVLGDSPDATPEESSAAAAPAERSTTEEAPAEEAPAEEAPAQETAEPSASAGGQAESASTTAVSPNGAPRPRTSPLARRLAREHGLDITTIQGSGPKGRIVRADIEAAAKERRGAPAERAAETAASPAEETPAPAAGARERRDDGRDSEEVEINNIRRVSARRLLEAKQTVPHFYVRRTIDAEALKEFRVQVNSQLESTGNKVSVNDLIVKAVATTLRLHPEVNASWVDDTLLRHRRINVGVAVAVPGGLVVPVLQDADKTPLSEIASRSRELAGKARDGKLTPQEMSGSTFSVSNLGMYGVDSFAAVINPPDAAILAVGAMRQQPVVRDGAVVPRNTINLEMSVDHRAVDGAVGAAFLKELTEVLEEPMRIIL